MKPLSEKELKEDKEYWICMDCQKGIPHYFNTKKQALKEFRKKENVLLEQANLRRITWKTYIRRKNKLYQEIFGTLADDEPKEESA